MQNKGLATEYLEGKGAYKFIRKLLCLPFLPAEHIREVFEALSDVAPDHYNSLIHYVRTTWIDTRIWPVQCWSVYNMSVRTNNDVEGNLLNKTYHETLIEPIGAG